MASPSSSEQTELQDLKYLRFIEILAEKATKKVVYIYTFAKESTGPLKPSVDGVETTVKIIIGPILEKLEGKPHELLLFVEKQVDGVVGTVDCPFFHHVKEKSCHAYDYVQHVPERMKLFVDELQNGDIVKTARTCYHTYEPMVQQCSYEAWKQFLKLPLAISALRFATPATLFCARTTNCLIDSMKELQVPFLGIVPNIPVEKLESFIKVHVA